MTIITCPNCNKKVSVSISGKYTCPLCHKDFTFEAPEEEVNELVGFGGSILLYKDKVIIRRKGLISAMTQGLKGDKSIYLDSITAIQIKKPGFTRGYVQIVLTGSMESKGGVFDATRDENTLMISDNKEYMKALEIQEQIETYKHNKNKSTTSTNISVADEIIKLKALLDQGILTDEEFHTQKNKILAN